MAHAAVRDGVDVVSGRLSRRRFEWAATPGRLRLLLIGLVVACLAWGALSAFTAQQYSSAASSLVTTREQLSLDAQQAYSHLSDANDTAATAFLAPGPEPAATRARYDSDVADAGREISQLTALGGGTGTAAQDLSALAVGLPTYTQEIGDAEADNQLGLPLGAAYLRQASGLMRDTLLPKAQDLYDVENGSLNATSARATGLPLAVITLVVGLAVGYLLLLASRWLRRLTNRVINVGVVAAGVLLAVSMVWLATAYLGARSDVLSAQARGSATVEAAQRYGGLSLTGAEECREQSGLPRLLHGL